MMRGLLGLAALALLAVEPAHAQTPSWWPGTSVLKMCSADDREVILDYFANGGKWRRTCRLADDSVRRPVVGVLDVTPRGFYDLDDEAQIFLDLYKPQTCDGAAAIAREVFGFIGVQISGEGVGCRTEFNGGRIYITVPRATAGAMAKAATPPTAPPKPALTCSRSDVEARWVRDSDKSEVIIQGLNFKDGGHGSMTRYYGAGDKQWPANIYKFRSITKTSECVYTAMCSTVHWNGAGNGYNTSEAPCTLTVDPDKKTLSASGTHGTFKRN